MGTQQDDMITFSVNQTEEFWARSMCQTKGTKATTDCQSLLKPSDRCIRVQRLQIQLFLVRGVMSGELFWYQRLCELICV